MGNQHSAQVGGGGGGGVPSEIAELLQGDCEHSDGVFACLGVWGLQRLVDGVPEVRTPIVADDEMGQGQLKFGDDVVGLLLLLIYGECP